MKLRSYEDKKRERRRILIFWCVALLGCFAFWLAMAYVAWHSVEKYW